MNKLKEKENNIIFLNCIDNCTKNTIKEILNNEIEIEKFAINYSITNLSNKFLKFLYDIEIKENEKKININNDFSLFENNLLYYLDNKEFSNIKIECLNLSIKYLENSLVKENKNKIIINLSKQLMNKFYFDNKKTNNNIISYNDYSFKNHYKKINNTNNKINLKIKDFINSENLFNRFLQLENIKESRINYLSLKIRLLEKEIKNNKNTISLIFLNKDLKKLENKLNSISNINIKRNCILILERYYQLNNKSEKVRKELVKIINEFYFLIGKNNKTNSFNFKPIEKEINSFNIISYNKSKRNNNIIKTKKEIFKHNVNLIKELEKENFYNFYQYLKENDNIIKIFSLKKDKTLKELFLSNDFIFKVDELVFNSSKWYFNNHLEYIIKYNTFNKEYYVFDKKYRYEKVLKNLKVYNKNLINKKESDLLTFYKKESDKITKHYKKGHSDFYEYLLNLSYNDLEIKYDFYLDKEYKENRNQYLVELRLNQIEKILFDKELEIDELLKDKELRNKSEIEYNKKYNKDMNKFKGLTINENSYINYEFLEYGYNTNGELVLYNEPNRNDLGDRDYY